MSNWNDGILSCPNLLKLQYILKSIIYISTIYNYSSNDSNLLFLNSSISIVLCPLKLYALLIKLFFNDNFFNLGRLIYPRFVILLLSKFNSSKNSKVY